MHTVQLTTYGNVNSHKHLC